MNRTMLFSFVLSVVIILTSHARQQLPERMNLRQCTEAARQNNFGMKIAQAKVDAADARASEAFSGLLPQLRLSSRFAQLSDIDPFSFAAPGLGIFTLFPNISHNYSARVTVQQPIFTGFRLVKNLEAARLSAAATQEDFLKDEANLMLEVKTTYWNFYRALRAEEFLKQTVDQVSEHLRDVKNFYTQGLATENDTYKVEVQLADVQVKLIEAESNRRLLNMALNNLMGKPLETIIVPTEDPEVPVRTGENVDTTDSYGALGLIGVAQSNRPELKAMRLRKEMSEAGVIAARAGRLPQIALSANYDYARPNSRIIPPKDRWESTWDVGVTMQWNLWDWFATAHQTSQAQAALQQAEAGLAQLQNAVILQVTQYSAKTREASQRRVVAKRGVELAAESYRITNEKFKKGVATNTDLLDAEVALLQAKLTYTNAQIDYQIAYANVIRAAALPSGPLETK